MKFLIFTPAIQTSAIGRMTSVVTHALVSQKHEVVIVRTEMAGYLTTETHDFGCNIISWLDTTEVEANIVRADACIHQIGDNYQFHQGSVEWLTRHSGIVCLHDFFLGNLFWGWAHNNIEQAREVLKTYYSKEASERFFNINSSEEFIELTKDQWPMTEWICSMASGTVTHSNWGCDRVLKSCPGPVRVVPLAYNSPGLALAGTKQKRIPSTKLKLLTIGHVNPNKRVESCIKAIGGNPTLRETVSYRLVGAIQPEMKVKILELAQSLSVDVEVSGEVDADTLAHAIIDADLVSCLRWPSLEAASASAIEAMLYGKTTVVTNTGFYSELPEQYVLKINHVNEIEELEATLLSLHANPDLLEVKGQQAQEWAKSTFTAENYARQLVDMSSACIRTSSTLKAASYYAAILHGWGADTSLLQNNESLVPLAIFNQCYQH
ncbi:glycosyltransferase [Pseudomonas sp. NPDC087336]|uniref:glycosyltransferase n=1 Tax=Pseudomonas sp. NPDC087336 TaxID=3364436 RepID=UPI00380B293D